MDFNNFHTKINIFHKLVEVLSSCTHKCFSFIFQQYCPVKLDLAVAFLGFLIKSNTTLFHQSSLNACCMNGRVIKITPGNEDLWLELPSVKNGTKIYSQPHIKKY